MSEGRITKRNSKMVPVLVPTVWLPAIRRAAARADRNRSQFIRAAMVEKIKRELPDQELPTVD